METGTEDQPKQSRYQEVIDELHAYQERGRKFPRIDPSEYGMDLKAVKRWGDLYTHVLQEVEATHAGIPKEQARKEHPGDISTSDNPKYYVNDLIAFGQRRDLDVPGHLSEALLRYEKEQKEEASS